MADAQAARCLGKSLRTLEQQQASMNTPGVKARGKKTTAGIWQLSMMLSCLPALTMLMSGLLV